MSRATVSQLNIYPIKSASGIRVAKSWVEKIGLSFDRRFMVASKAGKMITGRTHPKLTDVDVLLQHNGITLSHSDMSPLVLKYEHFSMRPAQTHVWKDDFAGYSTTDTANAWLSHLLGEPVQLLYTSDKTPRFGSKAGVDVSFADGFPVLLISEASLDALNDRSPSFHVMDQFRTNIVASGTEAFEEDRWGKIRIGTVNFKVDCPCSRCVFTTLNLKTGEFRSSGEPITTLSKFRSDGTGNVNFGMNLIALNEGVIKEGDSIEVIEYREPEVYADTSTPKLNLIVDEVEDIARDFRTFWFSAPDKTLPSYRAGQHLPIELNIGGERISRRYTLSSSPTRPDRLSITVKRIEDGLVSNWLHDNLKAGDHLKALKPEGEFHLQSQQEKLLFISGGSGVTPMMSMLRSLADTNSVQDVVFIHQCRSQQDMPFTAELAQLKAAHPGLEVRFILSQPEEGWQGETGRLSLKHFEPVSDLTERHVFVCGPNGFMDRALELAQRAGVPDSQCYQEFFAAKTIGNDEEEKAVTISIEGESFRGNNQKNLLEQAEAAGQHIDYSCRAGVCGTCKMRLVEGQVIQPDMPALYPGDREEGLVLPCCCVPTSDIKLERI